MAEVLNFTSIFRAKHSFRRLLHLIFVSSAITKSSISLGQPARIQRESSELYVSIILLALIAKRLASKSYIQLSRFVSAPNEYILKRVLSSNPSTSLVVAAFASLVPIGINVANSPCKPSVSQVFFSSGCNWTHSILAILPLSTRKLSLSDLRQCSGTR